MDYVCQFQDVGLCVFQCQPIPDTTLVMDAQEFDMFPLVGDETEAVDHGGSYGTEAKSQVGQGQGQGQDSGNTEDESESDGDGD